MMTPDGSPRLTRRNWTRFAFAYAWRDLLKGNAWRTSAVIVATLAFVVGFTLLLFGLARGHEGVRMARLKSDPLALCLWIGSGGGNERIQSDDLDRLRAAIAKQLGRGDAVQGCYPFNEMRKRWVDFDDLTRRDFYGRTLGAGDPLFQHLFRRADEPGVVVTRNLLKGLHAPAGAKTLWLEGASGEPREVPIVAVVEQPLPPDDRDFVMLEAFYVDLRTHDPNVRATEIQTGPVPERWPLPRSLPDNVQKYFREEGVRVPPVPRMDDDRLVWALHATGAAGYRLTEWKRFLRLIRHAMKDELGLPGGADFVKAIPLESKEEDPLPKGHRRVALYLRDLPDLKPAADVVDDLKFAVNRDVAAQVDSVQQSSSAIFTLLLVIVSVVGALAVWNTMVIQQLRAQQKVTEIGMLKAMGMNNRQLRQLYLTEAVLLWCCGAIAGVGLGWLAGLAVENWLPADSQGRVIEFDCPWYYVGGVIALSLLVNLGTTLVATRRARRLSPAESLASG